VYFRFAFVQCICSDRINIIGSIVWTLLFTRNHLIAHGYLVIVNHYCVYFNRACPRIKLFLFSFIYFRIDHFNHELIKLYQCDNAFKRKQNREFAHEDKFGNMHILLLFFINLVFI